MTLSAVWTSTFKRAICSICAPLLPPAAACSMARRLLMLGCATPPLCGDSSRRRTGCFWGTAFVRSHRWMVRRQRLPVPSRRLDFLRCYSASFSAMVFYLHHALWLSLTYQDVGGTGVVPVYYFLFLLDCVLVVVSLLFLYTYCVSR